MRSSTSNSELHGPHGGPIRRVPPGAWARAAVVAVILFAIAIGGWEAYWRSQWLKPSARNSDGLWAITRDRVDTEGGRGVVIIGSSRVLFDINLETWREQTGTLPIQLALEGTNPRPFLKHLADETSFAGVVVVGVTELLFFAPDPGLRAAALQRYRDRSPADRWSHQISMRVVEPVFAHYDPDTALFTVLRRQPIWKPRDGQIPAFPEVRKLSNSRRNRHTEMWDRVELDPDYREVARGTWLTALKTPPPPMPPPDVMERLTNQMYDDLAAQIRTIRARGGDVVFVRCPSIGPFREFEKQVFPRGPTWDVLVKRTDAPGVYFEDYPDMQDVELPEWSHIRAGDTPRFTRALIGHIREVFASRGVARPELGQ
jgi:hypothetical protein